MMNLALQSYFGLTSGAVMPSKILTTFETIVTPTCDLTSLANGAGRICVMIDNTVTRAMKGIVALQFKTGTVAPTNGNPVKLYLISQSNGGTNLKGGGGSLGDVDAAVTNEPANAFLVGTVAVSAATATVYSELYRIQNPGPKFSFVVWNNTAQALHATPSTPSIQWLPITDEIQ